jgi:hypothetical protein
MGKTYIGKILQQLQITWTDYESVFWWRDNLKFLNICKGISQAEAGLGETLFYSGRTCGIENYCIFYTFIYCHLLLMKTLPSALL